MITPLSATASDYVINLRIVYTSIVIALDTVEIGNTSASSGPSLLPHGSIADKAPWFASPPTGCSGTSSQQSSYIKGNTCMGGKIDKKGFSYLDNAVNTKRKESASWRMNLQRGVRIGSLQNRFLTFLFLYWTPFSERV